MPKTKIDVFSEGKTEKKVIEQLAKRGVINGEFEERGGGGEKTMMANLRLRMREWAELPSDQRKAVNILLLRDLDTHEGKTIDDICKSTADVIRPYDRTVQLLLNQTHENVFELKSALAGLQLALHIASHCYRESFVKATIDDYVLNLALLENTAKALLNSKREAGGRQKPKRVWRISEAALLKKITEEIPSLLSQNNIPELIEAKDYIRFYATVLQEHSSPVTFAEIVLARAEEKDIREIFAPLLAAIQLLST